MAEFPIPQDYYPFLPAAIGGTDPTLPSRYFRFNDGSNDYISIPRVTLSGAFDVSCLVSTTQATVASLYGDAGSDANSVAINVSGLDIRISVNRVIMSFVAPQINDGVLRSLVLSRDVSNNVTATLDGVALVGGGVAAGDFIIDLICANNAPTNFLTGAIASVQMFDAGTPVRNYPINDNSNDIVDTISGENGSVVNGDADDWGFFNQLPDGNWQGVNLSVPPWDSVDQILEVA